MSGYTREEVIGHTSLELQIWETSEHRAKFIQQLKEWDLSLISRRSSARRAVR